MVVRGIWTDGGYRKADDLHASEWVDFVKLEVEDVVTRASAHEDEPTPQNESYLLTSISNLESLLRALRETAVRITLETA